MIQDVQVLWQKQHSTSSLFSPANWTFKEEINKVLHLEL
jgi:hypothetical protein